MSKIREILQTFRPLLGWRSPVEEADRSASPQAAAAETALGRERALVLGERVRKREQEWVPALDTQDIHAAFLHFRDCMYNMRQRTKAGVGAPAQFLWEAGKVAGSRSYFYLQGWSEKGYLIEEAPKGWVVSRAAKIASQSQFIRDRSAYDYVTVYQADNDKSLIRVSSVIMGENLVSLALYEDFMAKLIRDQAI